MNWWMIIIKNDIKIFYSYRLLQSPTEPPRNNVWYFIRLIRLFRSYNYYNYYYYTLARLFVNVIAGNFESLNHYIYARFRGSSGVRGFIRVSPTGFIIKRIIISPLADVTSARAPKVKGNIIIYISQRLKYIHFFVLHAVKYLFNP